MSEQQLARLRDKALRETRDGMLNWELLRELKGNG